MLDLIAGALLVALAVLVVYYEHKASRLERQVEMAKARYMELRSELELVRGRSVPKAAPQAQPSSRPRPMLQLLHGKPAVPGTAEFDELMQDFEPWTCGARKGELVCTLQPHTTRLHLDERAGNRHTSATFTVDA